jgi:hypothetical protein
VSSGRVVKTGTSLIYFCPAAPNVRLSCDINGAEPLDVPLASVCERPELPLLRAVSSTNMGTADTDLTIEWMSADDEGRLSVVATRVFRPGEPVLVPVADASRRLVRFSRRGVSPVTALATDLRDTGWRLPAPVEGGEVIIQRARAVVTVERYRLVADGTEIAREHDTGDILTLQGLPAGSYELTPMYAGGVPGRVRKLRVEDAQSTFVFVPKEDVGGAVVRLHPAVCSEATRISIRRLSTETSKLPEGGPPGSDAATMEPVSQCEIVFGGLRPGEYELVLARRESDATVRRRFEVRSDALAELSIQPEG